MTDETLPPLPHPAWPSYTFDGLHSDAYSDEQMREYVLLDRQQRDKPAPSAEPVEVTVRNGRVWIKRGNQSWMLEYDDEENAEWYAQTLRDAICTPPAPSAEQPDHTALLRQALEALEERYIGALRDNAVDALRAALGEKRC
jgi:hypothetical protein